MTSATPARPSGANVTVKELLDWLMPRLPENMKDQMSHAQVGPDKAQRPGPQASCGLATGSKLRLLVVATITTAFRVALHISSLVL